MCAQGIQALEVLESRLENANTIQAKEKYESEMKKELKKIQIHRNFFRSLLKEGEIKDSRKNDQMQDSCYAIEE